MDFFFVEVIAADFFRCLDMMRGAFNISGGETKAKSTEALRI